ncbi:MAG: toxin-antitoxin system HicB family antitoxin [Chloroflexi bacterium]|nr:toxin-antitoxin system HicB family antitoxin [Chloroflexota bacterium]
MSSASNAALTDPELRRKITIQARTASKSLNRWVIDIFEAAIAG